MTRPEENIDRLIRSALSNDEAEAFDNLSEQGLIDEAFGVLVGRSKIISGLSVLFAFSFFGGAVYCGFQFFGAETTRDLITWASGFFTCMMAVTALKLWYWMEMEKNATIRAIKRIELQIAHLASVIESQ
jgi:hypothetical protein